MHARPVAVAILAICLAAAACGNDGAEPAEQVASLEGEADGPDGTTEERVDFQEAVLDVAACLRDRGFEVADPTFDEDGNPVLSPELATGVDLASDDFLEAFDECSAVLQDALPNPFADVDPEVEARVRDGLAAYAECMRENGVEAFPDPLPTGQPFRARDVIALGADPDLDAGQEACQPLLASLPQGE